MRNTIRGVLPALLLVVLSGCGSNVTWVPSDSVALSPKPEKSEMMVTSSTPSRPHRVIGELSVSLAIKPSFKETSTYDQAVEQLKAEARKRGADAVVAVKTLDTQKDSKRGCLTLVGTLVIFTAPEPMAKVG